VRTGAFEQAAAVLGQLVSADPTNRRAREMLAFALESLGDLEGERRVRSALASEFPDDARIQTDYGRVLERSGEEGGALRAYRHARELRADGSELDMAIERMRGRTALEIGTPLSVMSDPEATASSVQAGVAAPLGSRTRVALLGSHHAASSRTSPEATTSDALALSLVLQRGAGAYWTVGPELHSISRPGGVPRGLGVGGALSGRAPLGRSFEADGRAEVETPWDEAAVAVLRGGRNTAIEGHLYSHGFSRRLLLQAGARRRRLSILAADATRRPEAWQSLRIAGADVVVWRKPGAALRGEMLDERLTAPTTIASALTLAYRHYDVSTRTTPEFGAVIGIVPHGSVDEGSFAATMVSPRGGLGLQLQGGLARDSGRPARTWRGGGALIWAPRPTIRIGLGYEEASEVAAGLVGRRRAGWSRFHVDLR
jgi:hypothetical protein